MRDEKEWKHESRYEYHVPLHVKPVQSKKGGVTDAKLMIILERHKSVICRFVCD